MYKIKFGTDGWRAIIAKDYTIDNLKRVTEATARWMLTKKMDKVVVGYDCRFGGKMFSETAAQVFAHFGIHVIMSDHYVSTPMVSLAVVETNSDMGIVITASHNPPDYNGFKLKSSYGGPTIPAEIEEVESIIPDNAMGSLTPLDTLKENGLIEYMDLEEIYMGKVREYFDLDAIRQNVKLAYDGMYGAGQNVIRRLFPSAHLLHCDFNPGFHGRAPEPILRNLPEIADFLNQSDDFNLGLANDGDADRIGLFDEDGKFVDSHHILLLLLYYLFKFKGLEGKVIYTFSVTNKMKKLADHFGLDSEETKIGFKYIAEIMQNEDVLVGGEESGGLAVKGHIPERDGIWVGLIIMEFMAKTGKSLKQLIQEVYEIVGSFDFSRDDLHISEAQKSSIIHYCQEGKLTAIGAHQVLETMTLDGFKYILPDDSWVMIRPSGTEPVLRVYAQAPDQSKVKNLLADTHAVLKSI
jgi:phosphomannomutase